MVCQQPTDNPDSSLHEMDPEEWRKKLMVPAPPQTWFKGSISSILLPVLCGAVPVYTFGLALPFLLHIVCTSPTPHALSTSKATFSGPSQFAVHVGLMAVICLASCPLDAMPYSLVLALSLILLQGGDVETNPGPETSGQQLSSDQIIFQKHYLELKRYLDASIMPYLIQNHLLTLDQGGELCFDTPSSSDKIEKMLQWLPESPNFLNRFIDCLLQSADSEEDISHVHKRLANSLQVARKDTQASRSLEAGPCQPHDNEQSGYSLHVRSIIPSIIGHSSGDGTSAVSRSEISEFHSQPNEVANTDSRQNLERPDHEPLALAAVQLPCQVQGFKCMCGNCTLQTWFSGQCSEPLFPYLRIEHLSPVERRQLQHKLMDAFTNIVCAFAKLSQCTCQSLVNRGVSVEQLAVCLVSLKPYPEVYCRESVFDSHIREAIGHSKSIERMWCNVVSRFISFFGYRILEVIVDTLGSDDDKHRLEEYNDHFKAFAQQSVFTCSPSVCECESVHGSNLVIKYDEGDHCHLQKTYTLSHLQHFLRMIGQVLGIPEVALHTCRIDEGCIQLSCKIPKFLVPEVFPLAVDQKETLFDAGVISITCGDGDQIIHQYKFSPPVSVHHSLPCKWDLRFMSPTYDVVYKESIDHPDRFWGYLGRTLISWESMQSGKFTKAVECADMREGGNEWYIGGKLNVSVNCLDRHDPKKAALIFVTDDPRQPQYISYGELLIMTCKIGRVLQKYGVKRKDVVVISLPSCPEAVASMLAIARIGACHCNVPAEFGVKAVKTRMENVKPVAVITCGAATIDGRVINPVETMKQVVNDCNFIKMVFMIYTSELPASEKYTDLEKEMSAVPSDCPPETMDSNDPLFISYTSGSEADPKAIMHTQAGLLVLTAATHRYLFDYNAESSDVFAALCDIAWAGNFHYSVYGSLCNGGTSVLFGPTKYHPGAGYYKQCVEAAKITHVLTTPAMIRDMISHDAPIGINYDTSSLKLVAYVGEALRKRDQEWYQYAFGPGKCCTLLNTWGQTETGALLTAGNSDLSMKPFFGIDLAVVDEKAGRIQNANNENVDGELCLAKCFPGLSKSIYGSDKFKKYFDLGLYFTGDRAKQTPERYYQLEGRVEDFLDLKGTRISPAEIEMEMSKHKGVADVAVVGYYEENCGYGIMAFVVLKQGVQTTEEATIKKYLIQCPQTVVGSKVKDIFVTTEFIHRLPQTYTGKIFRRFLREIAPMVAAFRRGEGRCFQLDLNQFQFANNWNIRKLLQNYTNIRII